MVGRRAVRQGGLPAGSLALRTRAGIYSPSPQSSPVKGEEEHPSGWPGIVGWGQAPALHLSFDPRLSLFGRRSVGVAGRCRNSSRIGVRDMLSYQDWRRSCLPPPLWIPAPYRGTGHASDRRNDGWGAGLTSARAVASGTFEAA